MTGPEHFQEAERLLEPGEHDEHEPDLVARDIALARVHAQLAVAAYLADISAAATHLHGLVVDILERDALNLRTVLEAVLKLHARQDKPVRSWDQVCEAHLKATATLKLRDRAAAFAEIRECPDCRYTECYVCAHCRHECPDSDEWPCPTVRAITAALSGKGAGDGR